MIKRTQLDEIIQFIDFKKAVIIFGARQVGKTTLTEQIAEVLKIPFRYFNADEILVRETWKPENVETLLSLIGESKLVVLDEAQMLENAGLILKILIDRKLGIQFIITGSSSLDIANSTYESLTGRKWTFELYPLSIHEMVKNFGLFEVRKNLENYMVFGTYPEVINEKDKAKAALSNIMQSYLYKDILALAGIRKPATLDKLVKALAYQIGQEVSLNELSRITGLDVKTVDAYIDLLQKTFIIFVLPSFSRNLRNELAKGKKIYFYDNGIRNAVINNFSPCSIRDDIGQLWENFIVSERMKYNNIMRNHVNSYFWRTTAQQEIDYIEETDGQITAFEIKWSPNKKAKFSITFTNAYEPKETKLIHRENFWNWLGV